MIVKKTIKKILAILFSVCLLLSCFIINSSAAVETCPHGYRTYGDHMLNGGVGQYGNFKRYYYIFDGFNHYYLDWIRTGVDEWVHTTSGVGVTTSISIYETSNKSDAVIEFLNSSYYAAGMTGYTEFYLYQEGFSPEEKGTRNWGWTRMVLNTDYMDYEISLENYQKKARCMHELGHGLGLTDNYGSFNLMHPYATSCYATRATAAECKLINHIYG